MLSTYSSDVFIKLSHGGGQRPHTSVFVTTWHLWQPELPKKQKKTACTTTLLCDIKKTYHTPHIFDAGHITLRCVYLFLHHMTSKPSAVVANVLFFYVLKKPLSLSAFFDKDEMSLWCSWLTQTLHHGGDLFGEVTVVSHHFWWSSWWLFADSNETKIFSLSVARRRG